MSYHPVLWWNDTDKLNGRWSFVGQIEVVEVLKLSCHFVL
jgi:hypothetical protein